MAKIKITRNIGFLLLAIFLIAFGLFALIPALASLRIVPDILAIAAGVFILIGRQANVTRSNGRVPSFYPGSLKPTAHCSFTHI
jgi:hypothetical protein